MTGGYLTIKSPVMKLKGEQQQLALLHEADDLMLEGKQGPELVYKSLDFLGSTPW